jgi:hypothetical protein
MMKRRKYVFSADSQSTDHDEGEDSSREDIEKSKKNGFMAQYQTLLARYPYPMNACQSALIASFSNATSQYIQFTQQSKGGVDEDFHLRLDFCCAMAMTNILVITPTLLMFNKFVIQGSLFRNAPIWQRVCVDQFVMSPILTAAIVASRLGFLVMFGSEFHTWGSFVQAVVDKAPTAVTSSILFWVPQRFVAYSYCPPHLLLLFGSRSLPFVGTRIATLISHSHYYPDCAVALLLFFAVLIW